MPSVIDTLLVKLNLDASGLKTGAREAETQVRKTREQIEALAKDIEGAANRISGAFERAALRIGMFVAALAGANTLTSFAAQAASSSASLKLAADTLGMAPSRLSQIRQAVEKSGGSPDGVVSSLQSLNNQRMALATTPGAPIPTWATRLGVNVLGTTSATDYLDKLAAGANKNGEKVEDFIWQAGSLGVEAGTARFWFQNDAKKREATFGEQSKTAWTEEQVTKLDKLRESWVALSQTVAGFGRAVLEASEGPIKGLIDKVRELASDPSVKEFAVGKIESFVKAVEGFDWKKFNASLGDISGKIDAIAKAMGGWGAISADFLALWAAEKIATVVAGIGLIKIAMSGAGIGGGWFAVAGGVAAAGAAALYLYSQNNTENSDEGAAAKLHLRGVGSPSNGQVERQKRFDSLPWWQKLIVDPDLMSLNEAYPSASERIGEAGRESRRGNALSNGVSVQVQGRDVSEASPLPVSLGDKLWSMLGVGSARAAESGGGGSSGGGAGAGSGAGAGVSGRGGSMGTEIGWGALPPTPETAALAAKFKQVYPHLTSEQCVALVQGMAGVGPTTTWRKGENLYEMWKSGKLRPGMGFATFGYNGESETYGPGTGGIGASGIGRDHGVVVTGADARGPFVLQQWKGRKPHLAHMTWEGFGESGGKHYYLIHNNRGPAGSNAGLLGPGSARGPFPATGARPGVRAAPAPVIDRSTRFTVDKVSINGQPTGSGGRGRPDLSNIAMAAEHDFGLA